MMGAFATDGFGGSISDLISGLDEVQGEVVNLIDAALRDITELLVTDLADPANWPRGERRYPSQAGPHSADLWQSTQLAPGRWELRNPATYAGWVHNQSAYGGPPGLAERQLPGLIDAVEEEPLAHVSRRILDLIGRTP